MMRRQKPFSPARAHVSHTTGVLTPQAAASRLSRLEFDIARLEREIEIAESRATRSRQALGIAIGQRHALLDIIGRPSPALKEHPRRAT